MPRRAVLGGTIRDDQLWADTFELLPADPDDIPTVPEYTPADLH